MKEGRRDSTPLLRGDRRKATRNNQEHGVTDTPLPPNGEWDRGEAGTYTWQSHCWVGSEWKESEAGREEAEQ